MFFNRKISQDVASIYHVNCQVILKMILSLFVLFVFANWISFLRICHIGMCSLTIFSLSPNKKPEDTLKGKK